MTRGTQIPHNAPARQSRLGSWRKVSSSWEVRWTALRLLLCSLRVRNKCSARMRAMPGQCAPSRGRIICVLPARLLRAQPSRNTKLFVSGCADSCVRLLVVRAG